MKKTTVLLTIFFGFFTLTLFSQEVIWLDSNLKTTTKEKAEYYRPTPQKKGDGFWIVDYYKNGEIKMEGFAVKTTPSNEFFEGEVIYYHPTGKPLKKAKYKKGKLEGKLDVFYENGNLKEQGKYKNGKKDGIWKAFYINGKIKYKGKYKEGEKVGVWKTFYKNV